MELYRRNGVNPLGGCLPMVLQFPVFIGLYNALSTPIELRHAPFLWIKDLSRPDWESLPLAFAGWHLRHSSSHHPDGREHVHPAMDDADCRRSQSKKNNAVDAVDVYVHVRVVSRGLDRLLAGEQSPDHRPAVLDQPSRPLGSIGKGLIYGFRGNRRRYHRCRDRERSQVARRRCVKKSPSILSRKGAKAFWVLARRKPRFAPSCENRPFL